MVILGKNDSNNVISIIVVMTMMMLLTLLVLTSGQNNNCVTYKINNVQHTAINNDNGHTTTFTNYSPQNLERIECDEESNLDGCKAYINKWISPTIIANGVQHQPHKRIVPVSIITIIVNTIINHL